MLRKEFRNFHEKFIEQREGIFIHPGIKYLYGSQFVWR
jgi:hypothetical protein